MKINAWNLLNSRIFSRRDILYIKIGSHLGRYATKEKSDFDISPFYDIMILNNIIQDAV